MHFQVISEPSLNLENFVRVLSGMQVAVSIHWSSDKLDIVRLYTNCYA